MSTSSITQRLAGLLERTTPFDALSEAERRDLIGDMTLEIYEPGEVVLDQGQDVHRALYVVESGLVRLMDVEEQRILDMCGEGAQFGSYGLVQGGVTPYEARAIEPTVCALLAAEHFRQLLKENEAFRSYFEEDIKRYVRSLATDVDASGAFLLFDTSLASLVSRPPVTAPPEAPVRDVARAMADADADTVVIVQGGAPVGVVTEGDLVEKIVAHAAPADTPVMALVERPPVVLGGDERLFDAVRVMMRHRIRRVVVVDRRDGEAGSVLGLITTDDISHFRGLDPVATTERIERAQSVDELATIRSESNRRLLRLYQQGVQSEDLLGVVNELDDQFKRRVLVLTERALAAEGLEPWPRPWAWLAFGTPGRRESALYSRQDNGLVYADPADADEAARAQAYFAAFAQRANAAFERCGFVATEAGLLARDEPFRQPLAAWRAAYTQWAQATDAEATGRAAVAFDVRGVWGDETLVEAFRDEVAAHLPSRRLVQVLLHLGTRAHVPLGFFNRFELERDERGREGLDLRERGIRPIAALARALALDGGFLRVSNTYDRLRHVAEAGGPSAAEARALLAAYTSLADLHLRQQLQQAERGETPGDRLDPNTLHRSQQNLLREAFQALQKAQATLRNRYGEP